MFLRLSRGQAVCIGWFAFATLFPAVPDLAAADLATPEGAGARHRFSLGVAGGRALEFFAHGGPNAWDGYLKTLRPPPVSPDRRARSLAMVRKEEEVDLSRERRAKLDVLQPVLAYLERDGVIEVKVLRPPLRVAFAGFLEGAAVVISPDALDLLTNAELQAVIAHELAHEYSWASTSPPSRKRTTTR